MRLFTPEEANEALVVVRPLAERLAGLARTLRAVDRELAEARAESGTNGRVGAARRVAALAASREATVRGLEGVLGELAELGVQVKDAETGLLDFPARHPDGSLVLLCWRLGEEEVAAWHTLTGGFAGRKPLPF